MLPVSSTGKRGLSSKGWGSKLKAISSERKAAKGLRSSKNQSAAIEEAQCMENRRVRDTILVVELVLPDAKQTSITSISNQFPRSYIIDIDLKRPASLD